MCLPPGLDERRPRRRRKVAAGSTTFPPPDRSGASPPVGPIRVSPRVGAGSTRRLSPLAPLLLPMPAQRLRTLVPATLAPSSLLQPRLAKKPRRTGGPGMPVKLIEPPSMARNAAENRPDAIAIGCGSDQLCRAARPNAAHRAGLAGDRSPDHVRFDTDYLPPTAHERRPAPSRNSPRILRFAVQQARLLRLVPALAPFS